MKHPRLFAALLWAGACASAQTSGIDIPYERFTLDNGLTVIVHEDHKTPVVAVNVWYHVGSKNEKPGKTGFAHLFEHLMFNGSENFDNDYFQVVERLGATNLNGTTNEDRTNYFQDVPTSALDTVLWMESDRMGHLLGAVGQAKLDEQRGVVQNEKRQGENQPYGKADELIVAATFPAGHPYSWSVIGSMEDLDAASLDDVREWFQTYYGPSNAVVVLSGDIDVPTAREKVQKYFGAIPPGPPVARHSAWVAKREGSHRQVLEDRVPQARVEKIWNMPPAFTEDQVLLDLVSDILGSGRTSRFYKRLVQSDQLATSAQAFIDSREIGGLFYIQGTARPGVELAAVERALDEELAWFLRDGPSAEEVERIRTRYFANFVRGVERVGGFGGKADVLARGEVFAGDPGAYKKTLEIVKNMTADSLKESARRWLSDGDYILETHPFPALKPTGSDADRGKVPEPGPAPSFRLPDFQRLTLSNGLKVVLAERHEIPVVNFSLVVDSGYASDKFAVPGTARLAMEMFQEGTRNRTNDEIAEELDGLGAQLTAGASLDAATVTLSALKEKLEPSLEIYADVILNTAFPEAEFQRLKTQMLAAIQREKAQPNQMALRVLPAILFGKDHAYGNPFTGSGTEASVRSITRDRLAAFHETWFRPNNATLIIVGDTSLREIQPAIERLFGEWLRREVPRKDIAAVPHPERSVVYLIDRPGAIQSTILAGDVAPPRTDPNHIANETMNEILGGSFVSRINMNLREDKHWSYGASTVLVRTAAQQLFLTVAPVQTDKTKESMAEVDKELRGILRDKPPARQELDTAKDQQTLSLPGSRETARAVLNTIAEIERFRLPDDYYETYPSRVRDLTLQDISAAAERVIHPNQLVWVVVGDRSQVEAGVRELNFGEVRVIDADGNPVN
jgi:zinc protease